MNVTLAAARSGACSTATDTRMRLTTDQLPRVTATAQAAITRAMELIRVEAKLVRSEHPSWTERQIEREAKRRCELVMLDAISTVEITR
jgi:hypothetical protein